MMSTGSSEMEKEVKSGELMVGEKKMGIKGIKEKPKSRLDGIKGRMKGMEICIVLVLSAGVCKLSEMKQFPVITRRRIWKEVNVTGIEAGLLNDFSP